jgi:histidyl-tRNA synthetase
MKAADRVAAKIVLIIGDEEIAQQAVICRQMANGEQTTIGINDAVSFVKHKLSAIKVEGDIE